jgi:hypothetical protein
VELTAAAVGILNIHHRATEAKTKMQNAAAEAERDAKWLADMGRSVVEHIKMEMSDSPSPILGQEASQLLEAIKNVVTQGRDRVVARRNAQLTEQESIIASHHGGVQEILERFLLSHELPSSVWGISWRYNGPSVASEALVLSPSGVEATFKLDIPEPNLWSQPVRVDQLVEEPLPVQIPTRSSLRRRVKFKKTMLSRFHIVAVDWSPDRCSLTLQKKPSDESGGYEITRTKDELTIQPSGAIGDPTMTAHPSGDEAAAVRRLLDAVERAVLPMTRLRVLVTEIAVQEQPLGQIKDMVGLARLLIQSIAPYVRELIKRSPVENELSVKRELGDRRREEIFLPLRELTSLVDTLPPQLRMQFAPFGPPFDDQPTKTLRSSKTGPLEAAVLAVAS